MSKEGTKLYVPSYQEPDFNFLYNGGEMFVGSIEGPATTIYKLLVYFDDYQYPVLIRGKSYSKTDLICCVHDQLTSKKDFILNHVGKEGYKKLWDMCV